ncbi:MAG TPA: beta-(1-6) glucans synthase [Xanthobacteraceae bacterium]|nr:beta-(1-6) glucans synthase [Xanthobacteraceae bacterium]
MGPAANLKTNIAALAHFAFTALAIGVAWWWLGRPVQLPPSPLGKDAKLYCVSYAPFRGSQDPLVEGTTVAPEQIEQDIAFLSRYTDCVRTYSVDDVHDVVLQSARRHGMKVLYGIWVSGEPAKTQAQINAAIGYAKDYADVIRAIVVGNEVLLRGEMSAADLIGYIRQVKSQVTMPVTYADVWEFWLRNPDVQSVTDFITIHILPYWEDFPISAADGAAHVDEIRKKVAATIPNKDILIGEFGWPSAGRMREGARPSPSEQARIISETLALAQREGYKVNVIEAFDQPWKRALEGAVGGYWGIFDRATNGPKFTFGGSVSDHPHWPRQALAGILLAALVFGTAWYASRDKNPPPRLWHEAVAIAFLPCVLFGWALEAVPIDSFDTANWLRLSAFTLTGALAPIACAAACATGRGLPTFAALLGRSDRKLDGLGVALVLILIALTLLSVQAALGLVFDPRYRDLPFAPQSAGAFAFLVLMFSTPRGKGPRAAAEILAAAALALSAVYIAFNETFANWQAIWLCAGFLGLALTLAQARDAQD